MAVVTAATEPSTWNEAAAATLDIVLPLANVTVPDSPLEMSTPPLLTVTPPLKLYVPELAVRVIPVPAVCEVTLPPKLIVFELLPAIETASAAFACVMVGPHVIVPPLPPVTLNVDPVAPVSPPAVAPHVPVTALRFTPFVPPLELKLANVPLTAPVVRFSAVGPETLTSAPMVRVPKAVPLIAVVEPGKVTLASVTLDVPSVVSERPVVPLPIVPPLMVTLPLPSEVSATPVVAPVVLTVLKVMPLDVTPLRLMPVTAAPV